MSEDQKELVRLVHMVWDQLEDMAATSAQATGVVQTLPISDAYLGIDDGLRFHLLMALDEQKEVINRRLTSGIEIITQSMEIDGTQAVMVDIVASKRWRHAIEPFSAEAISAMVDGTISLSILRNLVEEYRSLWAVPKEPLDPRRQRGIIAELKVLEELGSRVGYAQAVQKWTGSLSSKAGGLHDIGDEEFSIEVKSYHDEPPRVRINHIEQLDHRMDKRLTLVGVHIISNQEGMTLPDFIDESVDLYEAAGCRWVEAVDGEDLVGLKAAGGLEYGRRIVVKVGAIAPVGRGELSALGPSHVDGPP